MYDLAILGGGPAASAAAVYAARKLLKTALITETFGGQSSVSPDIQNWIGTSHISGADLGKSFEAHVREYAGTTLHIQTGELVTSLTKTGDAFTITTETGGSITARAVLIATGSTRKRLTVPGADAFEHKGLTYCASCDGPLFAGQDVAVIGGGNAGFESAAQLLAYCKSVTLLQSRSAFVADEKTVAAVLQHPNMRGILNAKIISVTGDKFVSGLTYEEGGQEHTLSVSGIFVEIGLLPATSFARDLVEVDAVGRIKVDPRTQRTSTLGVWAAGDCTDGLYHQNNIAAGDAVKALEDAYVWLKTQ